MSDELPPSPFSYDNYDDAYGNDRAHVFHSWSAQALIDPLPIAGAKGSWMWDYNGNQFLDFSSQLMNVNIGHQHPKLVEAVQKAAGELCTIAPSFANAQRSEAARLISELAPDGMNKVFFTSGGAEATENAVKLARGHTGRSKVLSMYRSYHGATHGSIALTGDPRRWANEPSMAGVVHFFGPYLYRSAFHAETEAEECERALEHLESVVSFEGPNQIAAIILESVVGTNGILVPPAGYLPGVREICDRYGIVMITDEVMAGFGRCGTWFAFENFDVAPDLICFAKGVNSGYIPLGGVVIGDAIAETYAERPFHGGLTYSGHVLACASAVASIQIFREEGIIENSKRLGEEVYGPLLAELKERHEVIGEVRGLGSFWAIEFVKDRETREMLVPYNASGLDAAPMAKLMGECRKNGVWPFVHFNRLHIAPPLNTTSGDAALGIERIDAAISSALG